MCNYFQEQTKDSVRQIIFSSLFSPQGNKADDSRMSLLGKLVSMAVAVCRIPVLECAASWLQVLLQVSEDVSLIAQLVKNLPACRRPRFDFWVGKIPWRRDRLPTPVVSGLPCGSAGKESTRHAGDLGSIPGFGRSSGEGKGYPLQYSGLENSMNYIVHGVTKNQTKI